MIYMTSTLIKKVSDLKKEIIKQGKDNQLLKRKIKEIEARETTRKWCDNPITIKKKRDMDNFDDEMRKK